MSHVCELPGKEAYLQMILAGTPIGQSLAEESKEVREEIRGETHDTLVRWTVNGRLALPAQCVPVTARRYGRRTRSAPGSPPERKANVQDIRAGAALVHAAEYALDLDVDHPGETFRGHLVVKVEETRSPLELDAVELTVDSVKVEGGSTEFRWDQSGQKLIIPLSGSGTNQVEIDYHGRARRDVLNGFYVSSFGSGTLLTTMMQPVGCRRLLPCIDQPDAKAVFRLRVTTASELTVVSNAALEGTATVDGKRVWTFAPTPRMSTYLLYLGVGPFDAIETTHGDVRIVAVAPPGKAAMARRALAMAGPLLDEYSTYYGMPYPLPKLHLVAVPDLWAGGMENWGAIVFPEIGLLWDDSTSPGIVRWAVETLSHEIAHQWFGDLVTTKTWDDLWLNESFATFVASKMEDRLHLRTDPWSEFLIRTSPGYFSDSYASTHPVRLSIHDPAEISQSTDDITYFKGANVVRMIETFLGEETFRRGVSAYLKRFAYANAEEDDLWRSLEEASGQPVRSVMRAWVDRAGFPVVRVHREDGHLTLRQERFTFVPEPNSLPPWPIPLRFRDGETMHRLLFDGPSAELTVNDPGHLVLNPGRTSFIRVWYDSAERARRISGLAQIEPFDRWAFMNDAFAFTLSGDYSLQDYLRAATAIREVADYPSVDDTLGSLRFLGRTVGDLAPVDAAGLAFLRAQRARLGDGRRAGEPDTDAILRQAVARGLVRLDPEFGQTLSAAFDTLEQLDPALRPAAHVAFAAYGGPNALDRLFDRMKTAPRQDDTEQAAMAVEGLRSEAAVQRALDRCMGEGLRTALIQYLVRSAVSNPLGRRAVWGWLQTNLRAFERKAEGSWMLSVLLEQSIPLVGIGNEERVREYFARETFPEGTNGVRRGLELLKVLGALRGRLHGDLGQAKP